MKGNTWIYVVDMHYNMYIGIKETGKFQHSSFLYGSRVTSAGLIKVKQGQLRSLSPLSGHYRAGTAVFKNFCDHLREEGVDMSKVSISKAVLLISGIEHYAKLKKKKKKATAHIVHALGMETADEKNQEKEDEWGRNIEKVAKERGDKTTKEKQKGTSPSPLSSKKTDEDKETESPHTESTTGDDNGPTDGSPRGSDLPFEGKPVEELTDHERIERGAALLSNAVSKGLKDPEKKTSLASMVKESKEQGEKGPNEGREDQENAA